MGGHRFPPEVRLRRTADYRAMARRARRFQTTHFVILYRPGMGRLSRTGVTVSRRVGNAVVRNRLKRRIREVMRTRLSDVPGRWDVVLIARADAGACSFHEVAGEVDEFLAYLRRRAS